MKTLALLLTFITFQSFAKTIEIQMLNSHNDQSMVFEPMYVKAEIGDTIKFVPTHQGHTSQSVFTPEKASSWKGKINEAIEVKLEQEGLYIYECQNHGIMGMVGVIQVGMASNLEAAKNFSSKFEKKFIMNKDRLKKLITPAI